MVRIYTLPLFAVRPMYLTMRAFKKAFNDVILSRRAIHNMNTWYPDATPEELAAADNVSLYIQSFLRNLSVFISLYLPGFPLASQSLTIASEKH